MADSPLSELSVDGLLCELGKRIGIPGLKLDADSSCQLVFDQRWVVTLVFSAARKRWLISCPLSDRHVSIVPSSQAAMLRANFMGAGCAGGCLAVSPDGRPFLHMQLAHSETSESLLLETVESLLNQAERWAERLMAGEAGPGEATRSARESGNFVSGEDRPPAWMFDRA